MALLAVALLVLMYTYEAEARRGVLKVTIKRVVARKVQGLPDFYVIVTGIRRRGSKTKYSNVIWNRRRATFNQVLNFGKGNWKSIKLRVMDQDISTSDDKRSILIKVKITRKRRCFRRTSRQSRITFCYRVR